MPISKDYKKEIYRKSIHLSSLWMPVLIYFVPKMVAVAIFAIILVGNVILEYGNYKEWNWAKSIFWIFKPTLRDKELQHKKFTLTGSVYVVSAALLCSIFFSKQISVIALSIMLISDTFAALVGKVYGKHKIFKNKSVEGSLAFFCTALIIVIALSPIYPFKMKCVLACMAATLSELFESSIKIDDNLSIPLIVGIILTLL